MRITTPVSKKSIAELKLGERVLISGVIYGARDAAHLRINKSLENNEDLPFDPTGAIIYYVGPTPGNDSRAVGAAGPTTSSRMDSICAPLFDAGVLGTMGKGPRTKSALNAMKKVGAVYLAATGGAGALLGSCIKEATVLAYDDLGAEALRRYVVEDFPAIVAIDAKGNDLYEIGPKELNRARDLA